MKSYIYDLMTDRRRGFWPGALKGVLWLLSLIYFVGLCLHRFIGALRRRRVACKVISVGNVTMGGTGKTPLVAAIADQLNREGHKVAVAIRGYKGRKISDEAGELKARLKEALIIVGKARLPGIKRAIRDYNIDTVILDDGFQHWRLWRDIDIVTIDTAKPFGNGWLIPRGILREPIWALRRADVVVVTGHGSRVTSHESRGASRLEEIKAQIRQINPDILICLAQRRKRGDAPNLEGRRVVCLSGIGNPEGFERMVEESGAIIVERFRFLDHHWFSRADLDRAFSVDAEFVVVTEKDYQRIQGAGLEFSTERLIVFPIGLEIIEGKEEFFDRVRRIYTN